MEEAIDKPSVVSILLDTKVVRFTNYAAPIIGWPLDSSGAGDRFTTLRLFSEFPYHCGVSNRGAFLVSKDERFWGVLFIYLIFVPG